MTTAAMPSSSPYYARTVSHESVSSLVHDEQPSVSSVSTRTLADLPFTADLPLYRRKDLEIGELLGRGRFSQVHAIDRIRHRTPGDNEYAYTEHRYVMKHIQNKLFASRHHRKFAKDLTSAIADLVTEAMYLTKLRHPHIVQLRGLTLGGTSVLKRKGAVGGDYFLLLDSMEETLDQRIQLTWKKLYATGRKSSSNSSSEQQQQQPRQPLSLLLAKTRYAWQMADAIKYLHDHQILYRDLKPENVGFILDSSAPHDDNDGDGDDKKQYKLQLFDFGLARELDEPASNESKLYSLSASGTRRYMAPETFNPPGKYNYKADVYSWAMVLYEMLSHIKPFALFTCQLHEELVCRLGGRPRIKEIQWPAECQTDESARLLARELETLLHQAWNQNLQQRLSMAAVCDRVQEILQHQGQAAQQRVEIEEDYDQQRLSAKLKSLSNNNNSSANLEDSAAMIIFQKKTSTSELTIATESMASDSELDEDHPRGRWSHSSARSSISSKGTLFVRE
ncbi:MAP kinase-activated protein kinase 2 (Fragment) [Seminavis robusta]|uniref:MAP kinase-activated protein kinase 2 n=1 Tax=Seminavis robusta TaxID=568900 RepID=A0A9N8EMV6_9STRA